MYDLTFSIGLQTQPERAGASSGTVNKAMYFCGVRAARGDPWGHLPAQGEGSQPKATGSDPRYGRAHLLSTRLGSLTLPKATC